MVITTKKDVHSWIICIFFDWRGPEAKTSHFFFGILFKILWRNSLVQSFAVFWSVLRIYKITKFWIQHKWCHTRKCRKHFLPGFLCIFLLIFWGKRLFWSFIVFLTILHELVKFQGFKWLKCVSDCNWTRTQNHLVRKRTLNISSDNKKW